VCSSPHLFFSFSFFTLLTFSPFFSSSFSFALQGLLQTALAHEAELAKRY
jgi:hypothetical protein